MIDFATLQGVAIPEGVVTQIESNGVVLWSAAKPMATVRIIGNTRITGRNADYAKVTINGQVYDGSLNTEITVDAGTVAECYVATTTAGRGGITVNETGVTGTLAANASATYKHAITADTTIEIGVLAIMTAKSGLVNITEG